MKKLILFALVVFSSCSLFAQDQEAPGPGMSNAKRRARCSKVYIDLSTGINNNGGLLGVGIDATVVDELSINAGVGLVTTWGYKLYAGAKYHIKPCHMGWAFGGGFTYSTGLPEFEMNLQTVSGTSERVRLQLYSQPNVFFSAYHYWRLGRRNNRFYLQLGWSQATTVRKFQQLSGNPLTSASASAVRLISPGGLIVGLGFSFGANRR